MTHRSSALVAKLSAPPIADAQRGVSDGSLAPAEALLEVSQAVPSYPPARGLRDRLASVSARTDTAFYTEIPGLPPLRERFARATEHEYGERTRWS